MLYTKTVTIYKKQEQGKESNFANLLVSNNDIVTYEPIVYKNVELRITNANSLNSNGEIDKRKAYLSIKETGLNIGMNDFFIEGDIKLENNTYEKLSQIYTNVFRVTSVSEYSVIPHTEIVGV